MHIAMIAAISQDGFLTRGDDPDPRHWTSDEDKAHFKNIIQQYNLLVQGRNTYETYGRRVPAKGRMAIVLVHEPEEYADQAMPGRLEFKSMTPKEIVKTYQNKFDKLLVLGGSYVFEEFLKAGLMDEIWLTIEPVTNGSGVTLLKSGKPLEEVVKNLPEPEVKKLNDKGTLLKHYTLVS